MQLFRNPLISFGVAVLVFLATVFFFLQLRYKPCCDAISYLEIASRFNSQGILEVNSSLRTFAYPWLLSNLINLSEAINLPPNFFIFLTQLAAYIATIFFIKKTFLQHSEKLSAIIFLALSLNIYLLPYLSITLTDGLYTILCMIALVNFIRIHQSIIEKNHTTIKLITLTALIIGFAIAVRPASIWLIIPFSYYLIKLAATRNLNFTIILLALSLGAMPLYIQATINMVIFKVFSFFPIDDLGSAQIRWGIENIKYATWLGGGPAQNFYTSVNLIDLPKNDTEFNLSWYFTNPIDAIKLLTFKFIGAFDFDYLMPYPHHPTKGTWIPSLFSFSIMWMGIFGSVLHAFTNKVTALGDRFMPVIIVISWASVSLISALELRFTLPLITYFIIVSVVTINLIIKAENRNYLLIALAGWVTAMPLLYFAASFIRNQSAILLTP